ncbi:MAG TPA: ABC transporter substrate-binding protein [Candidatus Limnocylindria bacterium]|nr:ABC transporter substrate-binding protein [Candidatus Limnocylindria bacterium]
MRPSLRTSTPPTLLSLILLLAACGAQNAASPSAAESEGSGDGGTDASQPASGGGGTVSIGFEGDIASLDPSQGYDYISWPAEQLIFETLVTYGDSTELVPGLATEMPAVSEDGTTYTFTLHEGVNFVLPDGTIHREMTADDVVFSLNRLLSPNLTPAPSPVAGAFFTLIEGGQAVVDGEADEATGLVAVDDHTVEITITNPDLTFLNILALPFAAVVPADLATEDTEAFSEEPVGTGPYILDSRTIGQSAMFVVNPHYWGDPPANAGVEFRVGIDANTAVQQVEANQLDVMGDPIPSGIITTLRENPDYEDRILVFQQVAISYLSMDTTPPDDGPLGDVLVRQAMNYAIDKDNILQLLKGRGTVAHCIYPTELPGFNPDCKPYEYDPERAQELMDEAGVDGFSTTLYTDPSEDSSATAQAIQQDLAVIGIDIEIVTQEFDVLLGTITTPHEAPLVLIGWFQDFPDPSDFYDPVLSCGTAVEGGSNVAWYCNEENDAMAAEAKGLQDVDQRLAMYQELEQRVMDDAPWVPLYFPATDTFISNRLTNFTLHPVWFVDLAKYAVSE